MNVRLVEPLQASLLPEFRSQPGFDLDGLET